MTNAEELLTGLITGEQYTSTGLRMRDGRFYAECRRCEREYEWCGESDDFNPHEYHNLCGGSPRCIP